MKPILVHCHIYYINLYEELETCIKNITVPFELYITMVEKNISLINKINKSFPNAKIEIVENRGFDIAPFIHILNKVNLNSYSYIIKLHTKRDTGFGQIVNSYNMSKKKFRKNLLYFLKDQNSFSKILLALKTKNIGMISNHKLIIKKEKDDKQAKEKAIQIIKKIIKKSTYKYEFVAGSMFIVKSQIFIPLQKLKIKTSDFENKNLHMAQFAHAIERIFGLLVVNQDFKIIDPITNSLKQKIEKYCFPLRMLKDFAFKIHTSQSGKTIIKILKIPVYNKKRS